MTKRLMLVALVLAIGAVAAEDMWLLGVQTQTLDQMLVVGVAKVVCMLGLIRLIIHWAVQPAKALGRQLIEKQQGDSSEIADALPRELSGLRAGVNGLLRDKRESVEMQQKFLADTSHQLKTPFAVLRAQIQGAMSGRLDVQATLEKMLYTVDQSNEVIKQFLTIAKVEQLSRSANWVDVDIVAVARDVAMQMAPLVLEKQIELSLDGQSIAVRTDRWLLAELIKNLLSNAIHHSAQGGQIGIVIRCMPTGPEMLIWDNGGGLNETVKNRLFEPFQSSSGPTGVGLGLSICRQIAVSMQADVQIFNRIQDDRVVGVDATVNWLGGAA